MTYGRNTSAIQSIIDRLSTFTTDEINRKVATSIAGTDEARAAARDIASDAAWNAAVAANQDAVHGAARDAAVATAMDAARYSPRYSSGDAFWATYDAAWVANDAILATVTYDLATIDGPYTIAQRDLLLAPWVEVCGMPEGLGAADTLTAERDRYREAIRIIGELPWCETCAPGYNAIARAALDGEQ